MTLTEYSIASAWIEINADCQPLVKRSSAKANRVGQRWIDGTDTV
jgi:hypothetical protein